LNSPSKKRKRGQNTTGGKIIYNGLDPVNSPNSLPQREQISEIEEAANILLNPGFSFHNDHISLQRNLDVKISTSKFSHFR
jgi:hypothetical protein